MVCVCDCANSSFSIAHVRIGSTSTGGGTENAGLALVVNEMLLSSPGGNYIELFPVWPPSEPARFSQLRAKGGFIVSAAWDNITRAVSSCSIIATVPGQVDLLNPWPKTNVSVTCGGAGLQVNVNDRWVSWRAKVGVPCNVHKA